jgi:geranylgeranyl reductase family protein
MNGTLPPYCKLADRLVQPMDVAIVGGGPSGAWTARELARRGARVTIFDASHPREKPCGGGVTGRALAIVDEAIDVAALGAVSVTEARFAGSILPDRRDPTMPSSTPGLRRASTPDRVSVSLDPHRVTARPALLVVSRAAFDRALVDAAVRAGARLVTTRVREVRVDRHGAHVQAGDQWTRADVVIGADGPGSLVRRRLSRPFDRSALSIAAGFFVRGVSSTTIDLAFSAEPAGYLWSFPRRDHLAVGTCAQADACTADQMRALSLAWLRAQGLGDEPALERYAWPIPSPTASPTAAGPVAGPRWMLVGDAAGLVDPITREGIYFALQSAALAAAALGDGGDSSARYRASLDDEIHPELTHAARLKAGFFRGGFLDLAMEGLAESARIRAVMADLVAGEQPYRTLRRRLVGTFELRLAWKLLRSRQYSR